MPIAAGHKANFETLRRAFAAGDAALMECRERDSGELIVVLCAVNQTGGQYELVPFARLFEGNPYEQVDPPAPRGGYAGDSQ